MPKKDLFAENDRRFVLFVINGGGLRRIPVSPIGSHDEIVREKGW